MRWLCFDALLLPADLVGLRFCAHIICSRPLIVETPSSRYLQPPPPTARHTLVDSIKHVRGIHV